MKIKKTQRPAFWILGSIMGAIVFFIVIYSIVFDVNESDPYVTVERMKKLIPDAKQFIADSPDDILVLLNMQKRIAESSNHFFVGTENGLKIVFVYENGPEGEKKGAVGNYLLEKCRYFHGDEILALENMLSRLSEQASISIESNSVTICIKETHRSVFYLTTGTPTAPNSDSYYSEPTSSGFYILITWFPRF